MKAKKSLGQHFLRSERALASIVSAADHHVDDLILEIGPGHGVLTERLVATAGMVVAIEKDRELIPLLRERFAQALADHKLDIIEQDILTYDPVAMRAYGYPSYKLVANIPYYITGAIIEKFLSTSYPPTQMVLLMQREVAERIVARDGKQSVLSIAIAAYGTARIIERVPRGAFAPAPTVESAIVSIEGITRDFFRDIDEQAFFAVMKAVFGTKRKQLAKSLGDYLGDKDMALHALHEIDIPHTARPETLTLIQWHTLVAVLAKYKNGVQ